MNRRIKLLQSFALPLGHGAENPFNIIPNKAEKIKGLNVVLINYMLNFISKLQFKYKIYFIFIHINQHGVGYNI